MAESESGRPGDDAGPGPAEGMDRRTALKWMIGVLSAPLAAMAGWPLVESVVGRIFSVRESPFVRVGRLDSFPAGRPVLVKFELPREEGYVHEPELQSVWVVRGRKIHHGGTESTEEVTVFSPVCPHLGCHYDWQEGAKQFICPCHASFFKVTGEVTGGPSPRGLDTLPWKVEDGELYVKWEAFEVGVARKERIG